MKRDFRVERKAEETNGSRVAKFANCDVDGGLEREKGEGFNGGGVKSTGNAAKTLVLDDLQSFHESNARSGGTIPQLTSVSHHRDNTCFEEQAEVLGSHAHNGVSQTGKTGHDVGGPSAHDLGMVIEGEFPIEIETQPADELWRSDGYVQTVDGRGKGGRGIVATTVGEVHKITLIRINLHADRREE